MLVGDFRKFQIFFGILETVMASQNALGDFQIFQKCFFKIFGNVKKLSSDFRKFKSVFQKLWKFDFALWCFFGFSKNDFQISEMVKSVKKLSAKILFCRVSGNLYCSEFPKMHFKFSKRGIFAPNGKYVGVPINSPPSPPS